MLKKLSSKIAVTVISMLILGAMPTNVFADVVPISVSVPTSGQLYEFDVDSFQTIQEPDENQVLVNPTVDDSLGLGESKTVEINETKKVSSSVSTDTSIAFISKLDTNLSIGDLSKLGASFTNSLTTELNYKASNSRSTEYSKTINRKSEVKFSDEKAAQGYNNLVIYTGVIFNKVNVKLKKYAVTIIPEKRWTAWEWHWSWLGLLNGGLSYIYGPVEKSSPAVKTRTFVEDTSIEAQMPIVVSVQKYYKVFLARAIGSPADSAITYNSSDIIDNLALNKTASASTSVFFEPPANAVNGTCKNIHDKWCTGRGAGNGSWLKVDLGSNQLINQWKVVNEKGNTFTRDAYCYFTKSFRLQASADGDNWRDIDSVTDNTNGVIYRQVTPFESRYIRLYIDEADGDNCARIYEFQVFNR